jgi:branched-chain amino acid transport system permease protein
VIPCAAIVTALAGIVIGLPTLRLRGDYLAIVTLGFGEILPQVARNGDNFLGTGLNLTNGPNGITPLDSPGFGERLSTWTGGALPSNFLANAHSDRIFLWAALVLLLITVFCSWRMRDSRLGRAWIALREDEVAAASMGVPLVRTKLLAYAIGAALGGAAGAFLGSYNNAINSNQFQFSFSILVLSMIILGGLGGIWGAVIGGLALTFIDRKLPDILDPLDIPGKLGLNLSIADLKIGIFGFLLVIMMVLRPQGLFPERRRKMELTEGVGTDEALYEARA